MGMEFESLEITFAHAGKWMEFRKLEFTADHDVSQVDNIMATLARTGWTVFNVSLITDFGCTDDDLAIRNFATLQAVWDALKDDPYNAGTIYAYGELFGWQASNFEDTRYGRHYLEAFQGVYDTEEDFIEEWCSDTDILPEGFPDWIAIDWTQTFRNVASDFITETYHHELYVFLNH
jgi:hypothetical protein